MMKRLHKACGVLNSVFELFIFDLLFTERKRMYFIKYFNSLEYYSIN